MNNSLKSPFLQFTLDPRNSAWSLHGPQIDSPSLEGAWMRVLYHMGLSSLLRTRRRKFQFLEKWYKPKISRQEVVESPHGNLEQLLVETGPDINGLVYRLEFSVSQQYPLFLWQLTLSNHGRRPVYIDQIEMLRAGFFPKRQFLPSPGPLSGLMRTKPVGYGAVRPHPEPGDLGFFSNGWQSWSHSGAYSAQDVYQASRLGFFAAPMWYARGKAPARLPGLFNSDMFGVIGDRAHRTGILIGFLSQRQHFGSLETYIADPLYPAVRLWADGDGARLDPGEEMSTDLATIQLVMLDEADPLAPYVEAVGREHHLPTSLETQPSPVGWCSWYQYFQGIDQDILRANLEFANQSLSARQFPGASIPLEIFQIDDGFESQVGDWYDFTPGFPHGVAPLAGEILQADLTPGLWLAPFITQGRSKLAGNHPEWLLRNRLGAPVRAGFVWNNFNKALDLTHPAVLNWVRELVQTAVQEWGFSFLKLDFLYAGALRGRLRQRTLTRAQALRKGLACLREAAGPHTRLLGCGVPLGSAIGIFDVMRVGADVAPTWEPRFMPPQRLFRPEPNMPSARNAIQNTLTRAFTHGRWWINDPDCLLLRPDSELTLAEIQSLAAAIALTGGALTLSDDLSALPPDRLRIAAQLLPLVGKRPQVLDWFDMPTPSLLRLDLENDTGKWVLLAVFNWEGQSRDRRVPFSQAGLNPGDYFARDFWSGEVQRISGDLLPVRSIPAHGVKLYALRALPASSADGPLMTAPIYLGGDLHISQGLEVINWHAESHGVQFELDRPGESRGVIDLFLPWHPQKASMDRISLPWQPLAAGIYRFQVAFRARAVLEVTSCAGLAG
jgi:alpha-galactosidase